MAERDRRLVAAANAGSFDAFDELYGLYRRWAFGLALRFTGHTDDADDIVQEAFTYVIGKLPRLELAGRLSTLLYPVIKHAARAARDRRGRHQGEGDAMLESLAGAVTPTAEPGSREREELTQVLAALPEGQLEVLLMRALDELSLAEIATALDIPVGTVKSRLHLALATLREDARTRSYFEPAGFEQNR